MLPDEPQAALPLSPAVPTAVAPAALPPALPTGEEIVPLTAEEYGQWQTRLERARTAQKDWHKVWEQNLDAYQPKPSDLTKDADRYDVNPNIDFRQVEQKKAQLFYDRPEVLLEPQEPLATALQAGQVVTLRQAVINKLLGPKPEGVDILRTIQRALNDILVVGGIGWVKLSWRTELSTVEPDEETLAMGLPNAPIQVPIYERPCADYIPIKRVLPPHDAAGTVADEWDFVAQDFTMPLVQGIREFGLPEDFETTTRDDPASIRLDRGERGRSVPLLKGTEVFYYRSRFNADVVHPEVIYELVLIDGLEGKPARHRPTPDQTLGTDGRMTEDSVVGYPLCPLVIRDAATGVYPLSDCSVTRALVDELKIYRGQLLKLRDASVPIVMYKEDAIDSSQRDTLKGPGYFHLFPIDPAEWPQGNDPIKPATLPTQPRDNYTGGEIIERDIERSLSLGANQSGASQTGRRSATEIQTIQSNTDSRTASEQAKLTDGFLKIVRKLDAFYQRWSKGKPTAVKILGPQGAQQLEMVDPEQVPGRMLYAIRPDSQLRVDAAQDRAQFLQLYNLLANSPNTNRFELETQLVKKFGLDATRLLTPPQPPPKEPPKVSVSVSMADLLTPARPVAAKMLLNEPPTPDDFKLVESLLAEIAPVDAQGDPLPLLSAPPIDVTAADATAPPAGPPEHPGPVDQADPLDAHQERRTAEMQGIGAPGS